MPFTIQYDIPADPYELRELNPLASDRDCELLDQIAKEVPAYAELKAIDLYLGENANSGKPLFFLVKGVDGCGRSSVANWILARYSVHRGLNYKNFIVPEKRVFAHNDAFTVLLEWTGLLITDIEGRTIAGVESGEVDAFWARRARATANDLIPLRGLVRDIARQLQRVNPGPYGYGVCLEDVRVAQIIESAFTVFADASTVCIFIVGDYEGEKRKVIDSYEGNRDPLKKRSLRLTPLDGRNVRQLVRARWEFAADEKKLPFPDDLDQAFLDRDRTVKRVVFLISQLLELKSAEHFDKRWDGDPELRFNIEELKRKIRVLDQSI